MSAGKGCLNILGPLIPEYNFLADITGKALRRRPHDRHGAKRLELFLEFLAGRHLVNCRAKLCDDIFRQTGGTDDAEPRRRIEGL